MARYIEKDPRVTYDLLVEKFNLYSREYMNARKSKDQKRIESARKKMWKAYYAYRAFVNDLEEAKRNRENEDIYIR